MKKALFTSCLVAMFMAMGCNQELPPTEVTVSLDYSFIESGSMTKAGSTVYSDFYDSYVKTKVLTPKTFELTFTNIDTKAETIIKGEWDKNHSFKLLTGDYAINGVSHPTKKLCLDSLYLCFNDTIKISEQTTGINLMALYDSYLLLFDKSDKTKIEYYCHYYQNFDQRIDLKEIDNIYYALFFDKWGNYDNILTITRNVGETKIDMNNIPFEKGNYYYFNDISNSFDIPPMLQGN